MATKIVTLGDSNSYAAALSEVAAALREGALVVFPTETVYGVGANAADPAAVRRLRALKGRGGTQPFTVHIAARADAAKYVPKPSPFARRLSRKAWSGPLTLVCSVADPRESPIAAECGDGQLQEIFYERSVGLRCPDHAAATRVLGDAGVPVVASSANRTGAPPPIEAAEVLRGLDGQVDYVVDAGRARLAAPSTIVEVDDDGWRIQREGAIDERIIRRMAVSEILFVCTGNSCRSPLAEHLFRQRLAERLGMSLEQLAAAGYRVSSAGTFAAVGAPGSEGTLAELKRRGIDGSAHRSQPLTVELLQRVERIYTMTADHRSAALELSPAAAARVEPLDPEGPIADPMGGGAEDYARCAEQIERVIARRVEEFVHEDSSW